jgi:hypothetical protein
VHSVIADPANTSAWSFGGSILTFAFPMILFIVVACALYIAYTKPELVPGHRNPAAQRPVSYTAVPGKPPADTKPADTKPADSKPAIGSDEQAKPEGGE